MKDRASKTDLTWIGDSLQSGNVKVSINGNRVGDVSIAKGRVDIDIPKTLTVDIPVKKFPSKMKELSIAHHISHFLSILGLRIDVKEEGQELASFGNGVHSILGNVKLKISRLKKLM